MAPASSRSSQRRDASLSPTSSSPGRRKDRGVSPEVPEVRRTAWQRRRFRVANALGSYTTKEWVELVARFQGRCGYCGAGAPLHADHRTPLARGGTNFIENVIPACASCNQRKATLTEEQFRARLQREARIEESVVPGYLWSIGAEPQEQRPSEGLPLNFTSSAG